MTIGKLALNTMTQSLMTLSTMTLSIMTFSIMTYSIMTVSMMTLSIINKQLNEIATFCRTCWLTKVSSVIVLGACTFLC
jgi:hypothetical protein